MCLAVPGKIISIDKSNSEFVTAKVSFGGAIKEINIQWLPEAKVGDYVMAHVGTALEIISTEEAEEAIKTSNEFAEMQKEEDDKFSKKAE
ncbi:MAG: HypC/HybG/HupF family hydrogenase formation chaperone [Bacteroidales bacterium]|nr:HypC/HybG/HupF family hydrogenase formation chaperone [Bacteroidales bacterium]